MAPRRLNKAIVVMIPVFLEYLLTGRFGILGKRIWLSPRSESWLISGKHQIPGVFGRSWCWQLPAER
jgi:hypothetical protein